MARLAARIGPNFAWKAVALFGLALGPVLAEDRDLASDWLAPAEATAPDLANLDESSQVGPAASPILSLSHEDCGIQVDSVYYGECLTNARGGISTDGATQYQGLLELSITLDFERLQLAAPGRFYLLAQNTHGRGLTQDFVGDTMVLSNIDTFRNVMQVGEYWWEFGALDDTVTLRLGKQDLNREFYFMDTARDFMQSGFTLSPNAKLPSYPQQAMAAVALIQLTESLQFKGGVWDALATMGSWGFSNQNTVLVNCELEYDYALRDGSLPGRIALGAGYLSEGEVNGEPFGAAHGYSVQLEQRIFQEGDGEAERIQGLEMFAAYYPRFSQAPVVADAIGDSFAAGLVYTGLFSQRDKDVLGAGIVWAELFQGGTNRETALELFYRVGITERVTLQPDLQYIVTPSGIYDDAFVAGVRLQVDL